VTEYPPFGPAGEEEPHRAPALARPYAWTEGRTAPAVEIAVEALVETTAVGRSEAYDSTSALVQVTELCLRPRSLMEIAALLSLPLGVVRVLVADLMEDRLVIVRDTLSDTSSWGERHDLMERVLHGLKDL
jgi:hypothetical protein